MTRSEPSNADFLSARLTRSAVRQRFIQALLYGLFACLQLGTGATASDQPPSADAELEILDSDGFREVLVRRGDLYISGQPTEAGLERLQQAGVTTVINLRTSQEMDNREVVSFDEAVEVDKLGMTYVHLPSGGPDTPYSPEILKRFAEALDNAGGKVLLHCTVAWRASHLYTAYLYRYQGLSLNDAVNVGRKINLGSLPLSGFLGEELSYESTGETRQD
jgi:uncharacterized protein (TIGR01244 family)